MFSYEKEPINIGVAGDWRKSLNALGALQRLFEERDIKVKSYSGYHTGATVVALLATGRTPFQVLDWIMSNRGIIDILGKKSLEARIRKAVNKGLRRKRFCDLPMECIIPYTPFIAMAWPGIIMKSTRMTVGEVVSGDYGAFRKVKTLEHGKFLRGLPLHPTCKNMVFYYKERFTDIKNSDIKDWLFNPYLECDIQSSNVDEIRLTFIKGYELMGKWLEDGKWS